MSILDNEPAARVHRDGRAITFRWEIGATIDDGEAGTKVVDLSVYHHKGRGFTASVRNTVVRDRIESCMLMDFTSIASEGAARYSAKARDAFAADALAELRRRQDEPVIAAYLTPGESA